jgi:hypothetical protein
MAVVTKGIVVLDREQRKVCSELLWEEIRDGCSRDEAGELRLLMASARLYEMLDRRNDDADHDEWTVVVDEEIAWLAADFFKPFIDEYARPWLAENPQPAEVPEWLVYRNLGQRVDDQLDRLGGVVPHAGDVPVISRTSPIRPPPRGSLP